MIYIALEPQLDQWQDWVADTVLLYGKERTTVSYDEYLNEVDSITVYDPAGINGVQFYVGDGTLNEWRNNKYQSNDHIEWSARYDH